jgi:two-component system phosphate regulon response regulator PhoB
MVQVATLHSHTPTTSDSIDSGAMPRRGAILVVEDRDDVRQGLAQLLELHGFVVCDAADGEQALMHLAAAPGAFALILLDLILPGSISGRALRARQLADAQTAAVPTVVVSACEPEQHTRAVLRPAAWLEKPFHFEQLLAIVKQHVTPEH